MIRIVRYSEDKLSEWNKFNILSKNGLFMFDRSYMDYHKERFVDHSLMFYDNDDLLALLPMSEHTSELISHGGLTYGGFIVNEKMKQHKMLDCFDLLAEYSNDNAFNRIIYKTIPHFYHIQPAEEDVYALFVRGARMLKIEASTLLNLSNPLKMPKGRKSQISRARREGVIVEENCSHKSYEDFIALENNVLSTHHNTQAVHTADELHKLHESFPNNIRLFSANKNGKMIAGTVIYEYENVIHTQYMAADEQARSIGALDYTIDTIIEKYKDKKKWLDFGISTENNGHVLNHGLISQKEGFGGRTVTYNTYILDF